MEKNCDFEMDQKFADVFKEIRALTSTVLGWGAQAFVFQVVYRPEGCTYLPRDNF